MAVRAIIWTDMMEMIQNGRVSDYLDGHNEQNERIHNLHNFSQLPSSVGRVPVRGLLLMTK